MTAEIKKLKPQDPQTVRIEDRLNVLFGEVMMHTHFNQKRLEFLLAKAPELLRDRIAGALKINIAEKVMNPQPLITVKVGGFASSEELLKACRSKQVRCPIDSSSHARSCDYYISVKKEEIELNLIELSGTDLGFTDSVSDEDLFERAAGFGFDLCPQETAFRLAMDHREMVIAGPRRMFATEHVNASRRSDKMKIGLAARKNFTKDGYDLEVEIKPAHEYKVPTRKHVFVIRK